MDRRLKRMFPRWDIGADFIVLIPAVEFGCGWTDAGHADDMTSAREIAAIYPGSRIFQRSGNTFTEVRNDPATAAA